VLWKPPGAGADRFPSRQAWGRQVAYDLKIQTSQLINRLQGHALGDDSKSSATRSASSRTARFAAMESERVIATVEPHTAW